MQPRLPSGRVTARTTAEQQGPRLLSNVEIAKGGKRIFVCRAVDDEDMLVQEGGRHELLRKLLKNQGVHPEAIVTDKLASYRAAARDLNLTGRHRPGGMRENNRAENSHLPIRRRDRKQQKFSPRRQPSDFSPPTPPSTTSSTSSPTWSADRRSASFEPKPTRTWEVATAAA
jgi:putative transposase